MMSIMPTPLDIDPVLAEYGGPRPECSIARALDVLSTRSSFLLLREAFYGATRFEDFARRVGISDPVTSARLKELVAAGLLRREPYQEPGQRTRYAYALTEKGAELLPVLTSLLNWGDRWRDDGRAGPVQLSHLGCGEPVEVQLRCAAGHEVPADGIHVGLRRRVAAAG
jgi:DNA-binding HxlR family transcriptional regulator